MSRSRKSTKIQPERRAFSERIMSGPSAILSSTTSPSATGTPPAGRVGRGLGRSGAARGAAAVNPDVHVARAGEALGIDRGRAGHGPDDPLDLAADSLDGRKRRP